MKQRRWPRPQCCGSVGWGLSYHAPCWKESCGAPDGINGGLDKRRAHLYTDMLESALTRGPPCRSSRRMEDWSDRQ